MEKQVEEILNFWFGPIDETGAVSTQSAKRWFIKDVQFDETIRKQFFSLWTQASQGQLKSWEKDPRACLALILLLDQFSRNLNRNSSEAFSNDKQAQSIVLATLDQSIDRQVRPIERAFFYMPLMHAEDIKLQSLSVSKFQELADETNGNNDRFESFVRFAKMHKDIVDQFGRFPHRNEVMGRDSSEEEKQFLTQPGSSF